MSQMWRASHVAVVLAVVLAVGWPAVAADPVYVEGVNDHLPVNDIYTTIANVELCYRWTPKNSFDLVQMLWHSSPIAAGVLRIREDTGGTPGAVLREANFFSQEVGWGGAPFSEPYPVVAGKSYFITFFSNIEYRQSIAHAGEGGILMTYYWTRDGQVWNGPFSGDPGRRMVKMFKPGAGKLGDMNCDGNVDFGDINPFVLALSDPDEYKRQYPDCDINNGDINGDGRIDFGDINPFVELLSGDLTA